MPPDLKPGPAHHDAPAEPQEGLHPSGAGTPGPAKPEIRDKLPAERIAEMRALVERTAWSYKRIGQELGIAPATVWRYATQGQWRRPPGAAGGIERNRARTAETLWKLTARQAEALEETEGALTRDALEPLSSLTRMLGTLTPKNAPPAPEEDPPPQKPPRSIHELRDELAAHLERIDREEGMYWERFDWNFNHGGGI
jgi:hypothetical protein